MSDVSIELTAFRLVGFLRTQEEPVHLPFYESAQPAVAREQPKPAREGPSVVHSEVENSERQRVVFRILIAILISGVVTSAVVSLIHGLARNIRSDRVYKARITTLSKPTPALTSAHNWTTTSTSPEKKNPGVDSNMVNEIGRTAFNEGNVTSLPTEQPSGSRTLTSEVSTRLVTNDMELMVPNANRTLPPRASERQSNLIEKYT